MRNLILILAGIVLLNSCDSEISRNLSKEEIEESTFTLDEIGSIDIGIQSISVNQTTKENEDDFGSIYKYYVERIIGKMYKVIPYVEDGITKYKYEPAGSFGAGKPDIKELEEGEVKTSVFTEKEQTKFGLLRFLGFSKDTEFCVHTMEKDIRAAIQEMSEFDLKYAKTFFELREGTEFKVKDHKVVTGVILKMITYKQYTSKSDDTKIDLEDLPDNISILVSGSRAYQSTNEQYSLRYQVIPTFEPALNLKARAIANDQ